jgi:hypothetical protein
MELYIKKRRRVIPEGKEFKEKLTPTNRAG